MKEKIILDVPCATGSRMNVLHKYAKKIYFVDCESKMIEVLENKIKSQNFTNCFTIIKKIQDLDIPYDVECIIVLNQAIQFLDKEEIISFLKKVKSDKIILYLEVNDFMLTFGENRLDYFDFNEIENKFVLDKKFYYHKYFIKRYRKYKINAKEIKITFKYKFLYKKLETNLRLFNYSHSEFKKLFDTTGLKILDIYSDYTFSKYENTPRAIYKIGG